MSKQPKRVKNFMAEPPKFNRIWICVCNLHQQNSRYANIKDTPSTLKRKAPAQRGRELNDVSDADNQE